MVARLPSLLQTSSLAYGNKLQGVPVAEVMIDHEHNPRGGAWRFHHDASMETDGFREAVLEAV